MHDISVLAVIWASVLVASYLTHKTRLTSVLWYLFCGVVLVNIGLLPEEMPIFIESFAEFSIIIIMFALGFEEDTSNFLRSIKRSWGIALFGAIAPFSIAYGAAYYFWHDTNMALLVGLAMTATAVSLTMVSLKSEGLSGTPAATGIMTSAVLDDIASLALVAVLVPIATGQATMNPADIATILVKALAFFLVVIMIARWVFPVNEGALSNIPFIGKLGLRDVLAIAGGEHTVLALLLIATSIGLLSHEFGFHPAVGAYMAGLIIQRKFFDIHPDRQFDFYRQAREIIDNAAFSWIGPVFFVTLGAKLIFDGQLFMSILPQALFLYLAIFVGQVLSASLAARFTGGFDWPSSWMIGFGMLGRAELAFVVINIAYVQHHILSIEAFYTLMITMFLLNITVPLSIRFYKPFYERGNGL